MTYPWAHLVEGAIERFMRFVEFDTVNGCWLWTGCTRRGAGRQPSTRDYPAFRVGKFMVRGAVFACVAAGVEVPEGWHRDHKCRVTLCVNPAHLEPVTATENSKRRWRDNGGKKHGSR